MREDEWVKICPVCDDEITTDVQEPFYCTYCGVKLRTILDGD